MNDTAAQRLEESALINGEEPAASINRLSALESTGLLDSEKEEVFDRFTSLASKILGVPVALISLIDRERQFFKSQIGLPEPWATLRETPLCYSFCRHVVDIKQPLIISDTRQNPLVSSNPAVSEWGIMAYAGIPLNTPSGESIGAFCAVDKQPRQWSEHEIEVLTGLAGAVTSEIALRLKTRELEQSMERVASVLENISDAFFHLDKDWRFTYINDQGVHLLNRKREELLGSNVWEQFPDAVGAKFDIEYRRAIETRQHVLFEDYYASTKTWFEVHAYPGQDGLSVYFHDITQRKKDDERLRLLESAIVNANDAVLITEAQPIDEPGPRIVYVNEAFTRMTGYRCDEVDGKSPRFLQGPLTSRQSLDTIRSGLKDFRPVQVELVNYRKDGSSFWSQMSIVPVADKTGEVTHYISIQRDVSGRKHIEDELQSSKQEAERANAAKSEFLNRMSHDLRTPLNAILGFGQLLELSSLNAGDTQSVEQIMLGGYHLLDLINEVLDVASIESGKLKLNMESVPVGETCGVTLSLIKTIASQRHITIHDRSLAYPASVLADERRFRQILLNLLSNAVKYNREGGSLTLWCEPVNDYRLRVCVQDEGNGIPLEKQDRLFVPFDRLDMEHEGIEGTGIGLSFSQQLAAAMNGRVGFRSEVGKGSTFWLELPLCTRERATFGNGPNF